MDVLLNFIIKNIEGYIDRNIQKDYPEYLPFIDVLRDILKILNSNITLDKIAVISAVKGLFTYDDIRKTVKEIIALHLLEFTITKRDLVNGPNLMLKELIPPTNEEDSSKEMQFGYLKPKIEPESKPASHHEPTPEPLHEPLHEPMPEDKFFELEFMKEKIEDLRTIGGKKDEISEELHFSEMEKVKSTRNEIDDAKEAMDRMGEMLRKPSEEDQLLDAKMSVKAMDSVIEKEFEPISREDFKKTLKESLEKEKTLPPPKSVPSPPGSAPRGPPKSPQTLRGTATQELKKLFKDKEAQKPAAGSAAPPPASVRSRVLTESSIREPTPPPPPSPSEPTVASAGVPPPSFKAKRKSKKKMGARLRSFAEKAEETAPILEEIQDEGIDDDFEEVKEVEEREEEMLSDFAETSAPMEIPAPLKSTILPELTEVAKEMDSSKEYQKNIAIEYFDKMNPKKYYPLIIDITDIEQATTISEENILTGERKVQVKEKMAVVLKSSIVKVKPMFPGCSIVPEERYTDLDEKEDKLTFYVTPLVDDEIEDGRIEFIDNEGNIFHSAPTPSKVEDPRYARMIALYGGLASFLPKILETFGFNFTSNLKMATLLPFLQTVFGDMNLSNFVGISGIIITIIICIITVLVRRPNSVKKKFKVARVGRLKSAIKTRR